MATKNCWECINNDHIGTLFCGTDDCDCCGLKAIWALRDTDPQYPDYEGYANYETWRVALWVQYHSAIIDALQDFLPSYEGTRPYYDFVDHLLKTKTIDIARPESLDGVHLLDEVIRVSEIEEMMVKL